VGRVARAPPGLRADLGPKYIEDVEKGSGVGIWAVVGNREATLEAGEVRGARDTCSQEPLSLLVFTGGETGEP
jgi:hypothetical protein